MRQPPESPPPLPAHPWVAVLPAADTAELDLKLRLVSEAGDHLIAYAFGQPITGDHDRIIAQMKKMLAGYLYFGVAC